MRGISHAAILIAVLAVLTSLQQTSEAAANVTAKRKVRSLQSISDSPLPEDFDWQAYIGYNPDVFHSGVTTEEAAIEHFQETGIQQGLMHRRLNVILRYTACTGLINQVYSHISALALGIMLGAEIVLPCAATRDSFASYFSVFKDRNQMHWTAAPLTSLFDEDHIISYWAEKGVQMHKTERVDPFPDMTQPQTAFVPYPFHSGDCSASMDEVYAYTLELDQLVDKARQAVVEAAELAESSDPNLRVKTVILDLPCTFFMLYTRSNTRLVSAIAKSLKWAPNIQSLAEKVISGMTSRGRSFNTLHLRLEKDARDWTEIMGGAQAIWESYCDTMKAAGFERDHDLYIASGLLTYGANEEFETKAQDLQQRNLCSRVHYKELYLTPDELKGLNSEQTALVDFLVLKEGRSFVGFGASTFSVYLAEMRFLGGLPREQSLLVDASAIGTEDLFVRGSLLT